MKLTLEPTAEIFKVEGTPCRVWHGMSDAGVPAHAYIACVSPQTDHEPTLRAFAAALTELPAPRKEVVSFDLRFAL